jgi:hypothetical protein
MYLWLSFSLNIFNESCLSNPPAWSAHRKNPLKTSRNEPDL